MRFENPIPFEIPDTLLAAAGACGWRPSTPSYRSMAYRDASTGRPHDDLAVERVPLARIVPPTRAGGVVWFDPDRLLRALQGIVAGDALPAVLGQRVSDDASVQLVDGMHRFYASAALGFTHLPVAIRPWFEM